MPILDMQIESGQPPASRHPYGILTDVRLSRQLMNSGLRLGSLLELPREGIALQWVGQVRALGSPFGPTAQTGQCFYSVNRDSPMPASGFHVLTRCGSDCSAIQSRFASIPVLPDGVEISRMSTLTDVFREATAVEGAQAALYSLCSFAGTGLVLTGGIALIWSMVWPQRKEFAVRLALGATPNDIRWALCRQIFLISFAGILGGGILGYWFIEYLGSQVEGISAFHWPVPITVGILITLCFLWFAKAAIASVTMNDLTTILRTE